MGFLKTFPWQVFGSLVLAGELCLHWRALVPRVCEGVPGAVSLFGEDDTVEADPAAVVCQHRSRAHDAGDFLFGPTKCWIKPAMEISGPCWQQSCYCLVFTFFRSVHVAAVNVSPTYSSSRVSRGLPSSDLWNQKLRGGLSGCVLRTKCCV